MKILVVNTGSTSVKLDLMEFANDIPRTLRNEKYPQNEADPAVLLQRFCENAAQPDAVAHRVVHGGSELVASRMLDTETEQVIAALNEFAPLHNPIALRWIRTCREQLERPQVVVFDSAFFSNMPAVAKSYAIPQQAATGFDIQRYGFHGIAHRAMAKRWCELRPDLAHGGKLITVQLGGGCSVSAIRNGQPQDTSMGFSPAEGLVMATRSGDLDSGAVLHWMRSANLSADDAERSINKESGLLGVSGKSAHMRDLIDDSDAHCRLAVDLYCYRLRKYIGAYFAVLDGVDGIVFGGGVGEHMPEIRARIFGSARYYGIRIDEARNRRADGCEARISADESRVDVRVMTVDEAAVLAEEASHVLHN